MSDDESKLKVAGRAPAVKAGGMRIVQHKTPNNERAAKDQVETIGLSTGVNPIDQAVQLSTSPSKTIMIDGGQSAHAHKPAASVPQKPMNNIQQPRK